MWCRDVTHDVTAPPDDVTSENKRRASDAVRPKCMNMKLPKNGCKTQGRDHPDHWVVCLMPHPPLRIWAHPHDWSLQLLYLSTLYYNSCTFTNIQIYRSKDRAALTPHQLRVPPPLTPAHAPQLWSPLATPAPAGSNALGSSHQLWRRNLTTGHKK